MTESAVIDKRTLSLQFENARWAFGMERDGEALNPNGRAEFEAFAKEAFAAAGVPDTEISYAPDYWDAEPHEIEDARPPSAVVDFEALEALDTFLLDKLGDTELPLYTIDYSGGQDDVCVNFFWHQNAEAPLM